MLRVIASGMVVLLLAACVDYYLAQLILTEVALLPRP